MALPTFTRTYRSVDVPKNVAPVNLSQQFAVMSANMNKQFVKQQEAALRAQTAQAKRASDLLEYGLDFSTKNQAELYKNMQTAGVNNPELYTAGNTLINNMTEWQIAAKKATSREEQAEALKNVAYARSKINELTFLTNEGRAADQLFAEDFANGFNTVGRQGGVATAGNISFSPEENGVDFNKYQLGMYVRNGIGKNLKEEFFVEDGVYKIKYTSDNIIQAGYKDGMVVDAKEFLGFQPETVPKSNEDIEDKLKNIWTKSKGANAVYQDPLVIEGEISTDGNYITEKIKFKKENFFKDVANAVDPIAAGNLASGNQAEIDLQTTLIPHFISKLGDEGSFAYTDTEGIEKSIKVSDLKNFSLKQGDGSFGGNKWKIESQELYKELFRNYAFDYTGVGKTINTNDQGGYFVSGRTTKYTGPKGGGQGTPAASPATIEKINAIEIPFGDMPGPATESGERPRRPVDIVALVGNLNVERFKAGKVYKNPDGVLAVDINKTKEGQKNLGGTLRADMTADEIRDILIEIETGQDAPEREKPLLPGLQ
jgi:hypothetical protein